jgi:hypothetical protein
MAKVVIPLFYHLDRRIWTDSLTATTELTQIEIGQNNSIDFAVRFCNAGVATQLTSPAPVWICAIKAINDFAGVNLLLTTTGVLAGTGSASVYTFTLLIDSEQLRSWLLTVTGITALASLEIRDTNNNIATLPALTCSILPDYTLVGTTPTSSSGTLVVASGKTFTVSQTFAMPTDNGTIGFVLRTDGNGVGTWVANTLGSVTSVGQTFTGGIVSVGGSPVTSSGTLALTIAGTSGGIPYFSSGTTWATSAALLANSLVKGGGAGNPPSTITTGTGVLTALGNTINATGGIVTFSGNVGATTATSVNGNTITAGTGTLTLGVNTINLAAGSGNGSFLGGSINLSGGTGTNGGYSSDSGSINLSGGTRNASLGDADGGSIDLSGGVGGGNNGGSIDLSGGVDSTNGTGDVSNYGGSINLSGGTSIGGAGNVSNYGGSINLSGGTSTGGAGNNYGGSINLSGGADGYFNHGGSIDLSGSALNDHCNGGSINCSSNSDGGQGGSINLSSYGSFGTGGNGGSIDLSTTTNNNGGSINASNGGGSIDTRGVGSIGLGIAATRTTLVGSATSACTVTLPNATTTLAGLAVTQTFTQVNTFSASTASTSSSTGALLVTGGIGVALVTDATSSTNGGAVTIAGGLAVAKKLFVGTTIDLVATTATAGKITQAGNNLLHTFGTENLFLGLNAGNTNGSGQYSVGIGTRAMFSLTTGRQNLCFGWQAGYYITSGWDNMIFGGYNTGFGISTGSGNTIIGASADATNGNYRGAIGAGASCTADDTIVIGKAAGTYSVAGTPGSRSADAVIIRGALTVSGGATIASGQALKLGNAATTGLTAGVLAATTNASITLTDSAGQVYRIPCII